MPAWAWLIAPLVDEAPLLDALARRGDAPRADGVAIPEQASLALVRVAGRSVLVGELGDTWDLGLARALSEAGGWVLTIRQERRVGRAGIAAFLAGALVEHEDERSYRGVAPPSPEAAERWLGGRVAQLLDLPLPALRAAHEAPARRWTLVGAAPEPERPRWSHLALGAITGVHGDPSPALLAQAARTGWSLRIAAPPSSEPLLLLRRDGAVRAEIPTWAVDLGEEALVTTLDEGRFSCVERSSDGAMDQSVGAGAEALLDRWSGFLIRLGATPDQLRWPS